jgi:hypothetical protein
LLIVVGNHDIGYGSDMTMRLVLRWEREFGDTNAYYDIAGHTVAVINSMALDATRDTVGVRCTCTRMVPSIINC